MEHATIWWLLVGVLVGIELLTGTVYLLMLAIGAVAGALIAHADTAVSMQLVGAAIAGSVFTAAFHLYKRRRPSDPSARALRSVNLDVNEIIQIDQWQPDGSASVRYRGAQWQVITRGAGPHQPGRYRVVELMGNRLVVEKI